MHATAILALVRNDLRIHFTDRRAVLVNVAAAIFIAAFMGFLFGGGKSKDAGRIPVAIVNEDDSEVAKAIVVALAADKLIEARVVGADEARELVRKGKAQAGFILPAGFGEAAGRAFFRGRDKPRIELFYDPSQGFVQSIVEGLLTRYAMQEVSKAMFGGAMGRKVVSDTLADLRKATDVDTPIRRELADLLESVDRLNQRNQAAQAAEAAQAVPGGRATQGGQSAPGGQVTQGAQVPGGQVASGSQPPAADPAGSQGGLSIPYTVHAEALTSGTGVKYNGYAHSFAGMSVQFILFSGIDAGIMLLLLRERGLWSRLRAAPLAPADLLLARVLTTTVTSAFMLAAIYLVAMLAFGVRIEGSVPGFIGVAASFCVLNACFGLLLAAVGRTPGATRGLAVMATLVLVMIGGAWVPAFIFPQWLQQASLFVPTRWAVDGLDAVTWRGLGTEAAIGPILVLLGSALVCGVLAVWRFRWQS